MRAPCPSLRLDGIILRGRTARGVDLAVKTMKVLSVFDLLLGCCRRQQICFQQDIGYGEPVRSQEISETDGLPVILHHLPEFETVRNSAVFINSQERLRSAVGDRPVLAGVSFEAGTEAATARYAAGQLLIIEYMTPQAASEADGQFLNLIAADPGPRPFTSGSVIIRYSFLTGPTKTRPRRLRTALSIKNRFSGLAKTLS